MIETKFIEVTHTMAADRWRLSAHLESGWIVTAEMVNEDGIWVFLVTRRTSWLARLWRRVYPLDSKETARMKGKAVHLT